MMRTDANHPAVDPAADKERFKASRGFAKRVKEILGDAPDIVFEHVGQATFPTSVFTVKPFGKVVICGATSGYNLDFDVRYLWMKQKEILGSHFANAYECTRANQLMAEGKVRPVLSESMDFDGVPEAHQMMHENRTRARSPSASARPPTTRASTRTARARSGPRSAPRRDRAAGPRAVDRIAPMHVNFIEWRVHPFRRDRFVAIWLPALDRALAYGAKEALPDAQLRGPAALPAGDDVGEPRGLRALLGLRRGQRPAPGRDHLLQQARAARLARADRPRR